MNPAPTLAAHLFLRRPAAIISSGLEKFSFRIAACALSGVLLFACFPSLDFNWLVWVAAFPLLLAVTAERNLVRAFFLGYLAGAIFFAGSCYWFVYVMSRYGGMSLPLAVGVLVLFLVVFSAFFGAFALAEAWVARSGGNALLLSPFLWVAMEVARTYLVTGFPWNLVGYAVQPAGLRQVASVTAVYGLSFLAVSVSALLAGWLLAPRRFGRAAACAAGVALLVVANHFQFFLTSPQTSARTPEAFLVQPNIPLDESKLEHWIPWKNPQQLRQLVMTTTQAVCQGQPMISSGIMPGCAASSPARAASTPLVIWPENPAPFYYDRDPVFRDALENLARQTGGYVISGTTTFDASGKRPRNSAVVLDPQGRVLLVYDKIHLVPFGEYVPAWAFPSLVGKITFEAGDFVAGREYKVAETREGGIGIFICYEAVFPQLVRRLVFEGAGVLVNISDDGWFGNSAAAAQHLEMARLRAIENGRYLLRSTNNGITAIINPRGEVTASVPRDEMRVLSGRFAYLGTQTFYTAHGDVFAWLSVVMSGVLVTFSIGQRKLKCGSRK